MRDGLIDDLFNPRFVYTSPVHLDEISSNGFLERDRFAPHIDAAIAAWQLNMPNKAEQCFSVRDLTLESLNPILSPTPLRIDVWVEHLDDTSCVYGFLCSSENGNIAYARGERTITKLDPTSHRPAAWSGSFRNQHEALMKELPAYA